MTKSAQINIADRMCPIYSESILDSLNCAIQAAVLSGLITDNDLYTVTGRVYNKLREAFGFSIQEQQSHKKDHSATETMSYIAWEPSAGTVNGMDYTVDSIFNEVTNDFYHIPFHPAFDNSPAFLADMQTRDGGDPANIRWKDKTREGIELQIDEEQPQNTETNHTTEVVGYIAFDPASATQTAIFGNTLDADYPGTIQDTFININNEVNIDSEQLNTYTWPENTPANAILPKFDLSQLPAGAQIQSATLHLYQTAAGGDETYDVSVHKVINHNPDLSQADGYTYDGINGWTPNDVCYNSIPLAQADIGQAADVNSLAKELGYKEWNVTNVVKEWAVGMVSNYGLMLNSDSEAKADSYRLFGAIENTVPEQRPKLEIVYSGKLD